MSITKTAVSFQSHLRAIDACYEAREWAKDKTAREAWDTCDRSDWLLWWVAKDKKNAKREIVKVACEIARLALPFVKAGEDRPRLAIEAAEAWADDPTEENLERVRRARAYTYAAAYAAYAADAAADAAAAAAAYAAYAAYAAADAAAAAAAYAAADAAAAAAAYAADAAAYAAADAADAAAYAAAVGKEIHTKSLAIIRAKFDCPWMEG